MRRGRHVYALDYRTMHTDTEYADVADMAATPNMLLLLRDDGRLTAYDRRGNSALERPTKYRRLLYTGRDDVFCGIGEAQASLESFEEIRPLRVPERAADIRAVHLGPHTGYLFTDDRLRRFDAAECSFL